MALAIQPSVIRASLSIAAAQGPPLAVIDLMGTTLPDDDAVLPAYRTAFAECAIPFIRDGSATSFGRRIAPCAMRGFVARNDLR